MLAVTVQKQPYKLWTLYSRQSPCLTHLFVVLSVFGARLLAKFFNSGFSLAMISANDGRNFGSLRHVAK